MKALILDNKIIQVESDSFEVHPDFTWIDCPDDCKTNWIYEDGLCKPVIIPDDEIKKQKKAANAATRYVKETSGVNYNGHLISTNREDWMIMESTMDKIRRGVLKKVDEWKCADGSYIVLDTSNISEIELIVSNYIQGSFAKEKYYNDLIDQGVEVDLIY